MTDTTSQLGPSSAAYLDRMRACAASLGRDFQAPSAQVQRRVDEQDAIEAEQGFDNGILTIDGRYVRTQDPHQGTAWVVEGNPARPCWEYLPHLAAYVHLIDVLGYPREAVRFETPDKELNLDLAVLAPDGAVRILGELKSEARQLDAIYSLLPEFHGDPGKPATVRSGGPQGARREAWKLAHQLWATRAEWLWLVAAGARRTFRVSYGDRLALEPADLPTAPMLWPSGFPTGGVPRILVH